MTTTVWSRFGIDDEDEEDPDAPWWRQRRWIIALILIGLIILLGAFAIVVNRISDMGTDIAAEPQTSVRLSRAEAGSAVVVSSQAVPRTTLQVTGRQGAIGRQTVVVLDDEVMFDFDAAGLRPESAKVLDQLADLILSSSDSSIDVVGFTDALGGESYNLELSRDRAQAVASYLAGQGVAAERLRTDWRGEDDPVEPNSGFLGMDNPGGRAANRRVEVVIDENGAPQTAPPVSGIASDEHPSGMAIAVDRLQVVPGGVIVDARLVNRAPFPVELSADPMWLVDDLGYSYRLQPSWQNPNLAIASGVTVSGQLAFLGVVPSQADWFTLLTNVNDPAAGVDLRRRSENDATPSLFIERLARG